MGKAGATAIERRLKELPEQVPAFDLYLTTGPGEAVHIAANAQSYDTVLVLGGDGVIHEAANGLMQIPKASRPALGPIPLGSGNDYARTLHITRNKPEKALEELLDGRKIAADLGLVNGVYFVQTLSFGLDAAIALDTMNHRSTGRGAHLFADSGFKIFSSARQRSRLRRAGRSHLRRRIQGMPQGSGRRWEARCLLFEDASCRAGDLGHLLPCPLRSPYAFEASLLRPAEAHHDRLRERSSLPGRWREARRHPLRYLDLPRSS